MKSWPAILMPVLLLLAGPPALHAQEPGPVGEEESSDAEAAKLYFDKGVEYYGNKEWDLALEEFKNAFTLKPHWKIRYNIGLCYKQLKLWAQAMTELTLMLEEGSEEISPTQAKKVEDVIADLENKVAYLTLEGNIEKTEVYVDGKPIIGLALGGVLFLNPGEHRITVLVGEKVADETDIVVMGGQKKVLPVKIDENLLKEKELKPVVKPEHEGEIEKATKEKKKHKKPRRWNVIAGSVLVSLGAAALAGGGAAGIYALKQKQKRDEVFDDYMRQYNNGTATPAIWEATTAELRSYYDNAKASALASDILLAAGGGLVLTSLIVFLAPKEKKPPANSAPPHPISFNVMPGIGSLAVSVSF
jgi:hypothetical protein